MASRPAGKTKDRSSARPSRPGPIPDAALFQTLFEAAQEVIFVIDRSLRLAYLNPFAALLQGADPAALRGKHLRELSTPEDYRIQRRFLKQAFASGAPLYHENEFHYGGKRTWLATKLVPLKDPQGQITAILGVARDVSSQKTLEKALLESERKYRNLVEQIPGAVYIASCEKPAELLYVSPGIKNLVGYTPEEWLADWKLWLKHLHPEDRDRLFAAAVQAVRTGTPFIQEYRLRNRKGKIVWVYDQAYPVKDDRGQLLYYQGVVIDIARRKKAEEDLSKAEERYRLVVDNTDEGVLVIQDDRVKFCNLKSVTLSGYSVEEQLARPFIEFMHPDDRPRILANYRRRLQSRTAPGRYEIRFLHKNGETRFLRLNTKLISWDNRPASLVFATDITENKMIQEALRKSEGRYRDLFQATEDGVFITSEEGRILAINQACRRLFGIKKNEDPAKFYVPDFYARPEDREAYIQTMKRKGFVRNYEIAYRKTDGKTFTGTLTATLQKDTDGRTIFMGIIRDMTARRQAEEALRDSERKYRGLIETTDTGFVILDERGQVIDANPKYVRMTGHRRLREILNRGVEEWTLHGERAKNLAAVKSCLKKGFIRGLEITYVHPRGQTLAVEINATVVSGREGLRIYSLVRDITQRQQNELELRKSRKELRDLSEHLHTLLEQEKKEISRRIHDELGQQLTALKMDLYWLNRHFSDQPPLLGEKIGSMSQILDDTIHTVQNICEELRPALLDNLGLIAALEWQIKNFRQRTGLDIMLTVSPRNPNLTQEDATLIFRLFQEILNNIFLHARASRVIIALKKSDNLLKLNIRDNGLGITEAQINSPRSFGLLGMRERVDARGGQIEIRGLAGKGTEVAIKIPLSKKEQRHD